MSEPVLRLYPPPCEPHPLRGLYLKHRIQQTTQPGQTFVYADFILSLDGRISLIDEKPGRRQVPQAITNRRDWRLHMELSVQADAFVTTTRHLRAVAAGRHGSLLSLANTEHSDLAIWRAQQGLPRQPAYAAISKSLEFPARKLLQRNPGPILIFTGSQARPERVRELENLGIEVITMDPGKRPDGKMLVETLAQRGYAKLCAIGGPFVLHALLHADVIDRLYLTFATIILGGQSFASLIHGNLFEPPRGFHLHSLHLDKHAPPGAQQLFASFDRARPSDS